MSKLGLFKRVILSVFWIFVCCTIKVSDLEAFSLKPCYFVTNDKAAENLNFKRQNFHWRCKQVYRRVDGNCHLLDDDQHIGCSGSCGYSVSVLYLNRGLDVIEEGNPLSMKSRWSLNPSQSSRVPSFNHHTFVSDEPS